MPVGYLLLPFVNCMKEDTFDDLEEIHNVYMYFVRMNIADRKMYLF